MYDLTLIGIGTGNPDHVTYQGAEAIRSADLILIPRKGENKADLAGLREDIISQVSRITAKDRLFRHSQTPCRGWLSARCGRLA